ncbi:MAG: glycosyltransferase family 4 protein [Alphaproteobacteria bacterium]|nr:glycosyltransferase family 4 protein [Alphaproteobacteria bacterium]
MAAMLPNLARQKGFEVHLLLHQNQLPLFLDVLEGVKVHCVAFKDGFLLRLIWEQLGLPLYAWRFADVTFSPANFGPLLAPRPVVLLRNALGVTDHDLRLGKKIYWMLLGIMTWLSLLVSPVAIAVSDYARRNLAFGFARRVRIVHHGVDHRRYHADASQRDDFALAVGDLTVQKNFHTLIEAVARIPGLCLKIAGRRVDEAYAQSLDALVRSLAVGDRVAFLGSVGPDELSALYRSCRLFAFPSTVETFGNPLVEAMASGCAILCSKAAAMPEILEDAGLYAEALDVNDWEKGLHRLLGDPTLRSDLSERALRRSADFDWKATAEQTVAILMLAGQKGGKGFFDIFAWSWIALILSLYLMQFRGLMPAMMKAMGWP